MAIRGRWVGGDACFTHTLAHNTVEDLRLTSLGQPRTLSPQLK